MKLIHPTQFDYIGNQADIQVNFAVRTLSHPSTTLRMLQVEEWLVSSCKLFKMHLDPGGQLPQGLILQGKNHL